jgi:hypothetical protein
MSSHILCSITRMSLRISRRGWKRRKDAKVKRRNAGDFKRKSRDSRRYRLRFSNKSEDRKKRRKLGNKWNSYILTSTEHPMSTIINIRTRISLTISI